MLARLEAALPGPGRACRDDARPGHDDAYYAWAAMDWAEHAPVLGRTHWALRYPLVLPVAALIRLFGFSVPVLAAVGLAAHAAFLLMGYAAGRAGSAGWLPADEFREIKQPGRALVVYRTPLRWPLR